MTASFAVTWDYRCPFARNAHEHLLTGLAAGGDWNPRFVPFSLGQVHVAEGETDVWDEPHKDTGLLALQAGVVVRDDFRALFPAVHRALFAARHDQGLKLEDPDVVRAALVDSGSMPTRSLAESSRAKRSRPFAPSMSSSPSRTMFGASRRSSLMIKPSSCG